MRQERVFIGLGSNLGDPVAALQAALRSLRATGGVSLLVHSGFYANPPMGPQNQPDYVNAVAELAVDLEPLDLLRELQRIERACGRRPQAVRWGPRALDLDLLLYGAREIDHPRLCVPHPGLCERAFVLHPLAEIAPQVQVPGHGRAGDLARRLAPVRLRRLSAAVTHLSTAV